MSTLSIKSMITLYTQRYKEIMIKLYARGSSRRVKFVSLFVVILNHERVIWNTSTEISDTDQKYTEEHILTVINSTKSI